MRLSKYAIALAVTAAVTFGPGGGSGGARAQAGAVPTITNLDTGHQFPYLKALPANQSCKDALGNLPDILVAVRDPDPAVKAPEYQGANQELADNVIGLLLQIVMNTGKLPNLAISCEAPGAPA